MVKTAVEPSTAPDYIKEYCALGTERAQALGNRGPLTFNESAHVSQSILDCYHKLGFYVFEQVIDRSEIADLRTDLDATLARAPTDPDSNVDANGNPAIGKDLAYRSFSFAKPLSDPFGGTEAANGRYETKMSEPTPADDSPPRTIFFIAGGCQFMDSFLRHYGNPKLLRVAEALNGSDFTPFTDGVWIKEPGLGTSVSWHQDGTTLWHHPDWHEDIHGFNFMTNLYDTTAENALWVVPQTHKLGKIDIKKRVAKEGTDRLPDAVPMLVKAGDVAICNRQVLHGSFANTSRQRRVTLVHGFHLRTSVLGAETTFARKRKVRYDEARVHRSSQLISLAIDARRQRFADETPYSYGPLLAEIEKYRFSEETRETVLKNYNMYSLGL
ncbi:MAG: phytanoyl-CoA dioxygenase family protein [Gammaproteobacteria bacterium]|nr:phytanoyl-CoA dioxygenase family protein [Gammaproteobacteria bacterium]